MRVENQTYIHYYKGSLVMYALQDYIGEDKVDQALAGSSRRRGSSGPPYPTRRQFVDELEEGDAARVSRTSSTISSRPSRSTTTARSRRRTTKRADGKYDVTVNVRAKKLQADELGKETEVPVEGDLIDIGGVNEKGDAICLGKRHVEAGESEQTFVCDELPAKAGIDPLLELIDRHPDDNVVAVTEE